MRAEKICILHQIPYQVIPIPTNISSECGMCLEINFEAIALLINKLSEMNISFTITKRQ
jgi:hypothetical protein